MLQRSPDVAARHVPELLLEAPAAAGQFPQLGDSRAGLAAQALAVSAEVQSALQRDSQQFQLLPAGYDLPCHLDGAVGRVSGGLGEYEHLRLLPRHSRHLRSSRPLHQGVRCTLCASLRCGDVVAGAESVSGESFSKGLNDVLKKHATMQTFKVHNPKPPPVSRETLDLMKQRRRARETKDPSYYVIANYPRPAGGHILSPSRIFTIT